MFLTHAPHRHYGPLLGGDRDGAEGVDRCWCRARCHYAIYWAESAMHFPQNGRRASTWLRLRGVNDSHLTIGAKNVKHVHLLHDKDRDFSTSSQRCMNEYLHMTLIIWYCLGCKEIHKKTHLSFEKYVQEHCTFPHWVWVTSHNILLHWVQQLPTASLAYRILIKYRSNNGITFI